MLDGAPAEGKTVAELETAIRERNREASSAMA